MITKIQVQKVYRFCENTFTARTITTWYWSHKSSSCADKAKLELQALEASYQENQLTIFLPFSSLRANLFLGLEEMSRLFGISKMTFYNMPFKYVLQKNNLERDIIFPTKLNKLIL